MSTKVSHTQIYADRHRAIRRRTPSCVSLREIRSADEAAPGLAQILDALDQTLGAESLDPVALAAIGKKLDQWSADNANAPEEPFAYAASAAAMAAPALKSDLYTDLKAALAALSNIARSSAAAPATAATP